MTNEPDEITYALIVDEEDDIEIISIEDEEIEVISEVQVEVSSISVLHSIDPVESSDSLGHSDEQLDSSSLEDNDDDKNVVVRSFIAKRKDSIKQIKLNKRKVKLYSFFSIIAILTLAILLLESPIFTIDKVNIVEKKDSIQLSKDELKILNKDLSSVKDQQIYRSNFNSSYAKINKLTFVKKVSFKKQWPSTVKVTVVHRVPIAAIKTNKGFVLIDDGNVVFSKVDVLPVGLPLFKGFDEVTFGKKISDENYVLILKASPNEIVNQISSIAKKDSKYLVTLTDGIVIKLGDTSLLKEKLAIAWSIILTKNRAQLGYIDVSVPSLPVSGIPKPEV